MVTNSAGPVGPRLYSAGGLTERESTQARMRPFRQGVADTQSSELAAHKRERGIQTGRAEQLIELVVAAVTVVADIVTLALARSDKKENTIPSKPVRLPGAGRPVGWGAPPTPTAPPVTGTPQPSVPGKRLDAIRSDSGDILVRTYDGYLVRVEALKGGWSITDPDGRTTEISAHAQVRESDGGTWTFKERGSFVFGPHKVTAQVPFGKNGASTPSTLTIYSGNERVTIEGLNTDHPVLDAVAQDGAFHDDRMDDGTIYHRGKTKFGESWSVVSGRKRRVMGAS